ncbi:MAG TPA: putative lipid II flippase FtsW [Acidimicrobiales bacterium]|nr:putative lipid II flippase FtsW [Acidimicrobiales bacterium]
MTLATAVRRSAVRARSVAGAAGMDRVRRQGRRQPSGGPPDPGRSTRRPPGFLLLVGLTGALLVIGLVMVLSASSVEALARYGSSWVFFEKQLMWVALGSAALALTLRVDYHRWRRWSVPLMAVCTVALLAVLVPHVGVTVGGSSRWVGFGSFRVQPSELAKLGLILYLADVITRRLDGRGGPATVVKPVVVAVAVVAALVMKQPDMGTTLVIVAVVFGMLTVSGVPGRTLAKLGAGTVGVALLFGVMEPYRKARLLSFLHPWADRSGNGYQIIQSLVGLGSGGLAGVGLGASRAKWGFLPNAHTDFIFAIIGEELGLLGSLLVVGLFVAFVFLGIRAALRAPDRFGSLLAVGITLWVAAQAVLNIGAVIGMLPVTGVPLPLVSFGGSSMVIVMAAIGVLLNVAGQERPTRRAD